MKNYKNILGLIGVLLYSFTSCQNKEIVHPDFDYQTVYFASQYPIRTVVLGEDPLVDNTLDNEHKVSIKATIGGARTNSKQVDIVVAVDESLLENLYFPGGTTEVKPMPSSYYTLASDKISILPGAILGGVEVQLTDDFFQDPLAIQNHYAIPLLMKNVNGADSILRGLSTLSSPNRHLAVDWNVRPKDYVSYVVKFVNQWHGNYLRRGVDAMTGDVTRNVSRRTEYIEKNEVNLLTTKSLQTLEFPVEFRDADAGNIFRCTLLLTFDQEGKCTITTNSSGYTATGTGSFVKRGDKNSWGNQDRDALYLDYQVNYSNIIVGSGANSKTISGQIVTKDTLVMRDRAVIAEYFTPVVK
ncbi:DUF5627 domain-containing protein [Sphingobacterium corticibacterium]|uniref:DUF1735 domain-containing protein n=1 Tax=Sphingobacterium corticibacterium TaxID=2484746 RepID=A0A4Q6XHB7_9SPHI|nr:DUF5627 domain-containing protein [Sphingobacterium corticibacterium]RZF59301.1 DUF1735 domain-containing protein [Sphingobacterium corticibacterium]